MNRKIDSIRMSKEDRRTQILDSAMSVFVERGYNGTTTQEIAKAANISEVTLFRYFSSKREIFLQGIDPILLTTLEDSIIVSKDFEPIERLKFILKERIMLISQNYKVIRLILMESQVNPELNDIDYIEKISMIFRNAIEDIGLDIKGKEDLFRILIGTILSFLYLPETDEKVIDSLVDKTLDVILRG